MQTRLESFLEAIINTAIGFVISFISSAILLPAVGVPVTLSQNLGISLGMTFVSVARSYMLRRFCQKYLRELVSKFIDFIRRNQMQWISIKDELPEKGVEVLVGYWYKARRSNLEFFKQSIGWRSKDLPKYNGEWDIPDGTGYFEKDKITYWCPIPESPPK